MAERLTDTDLTFKRIKHRESSRKTTLKFRAPTGRAEDDEYSVTTDELPHPEFFEALSRLKPHVVDVCEFAGGYVDGVTVLGVTIKRYSDQPDAIVVTATKELAGDLHFNFSTPACPPNSHTMGALQDLYEAAKDFLDGKRAELDLFDGEEDDEKPTPAELAQEAVENTN